MRKNTSYLDSLNEGRQRRSRTSLDDLDRTLRGLEERIGAGRGGNYPIPDAPPSRDVSDRFRHLSSGRHRDERPGYEQLAARAPSSSSFKPLAHDAEFARMQEKNVAAVELIAADLKKLRDELQNKMASGLQPEFDSLRAAIGETYRVAQSGSPTRDLSDDIARLSDNVRALAQRSEDGGVNQLRQELEEVRRALGSLAREETVQEFNHRWDEFDRRLNSINSAVPLRMELEEVKRSLGSLAREETVQEFNHRWDEFDRRLNSINNAVPLRMELEEVKRSLGSLAREETVQEFNHRWDEFDRKLNSINNAPYSNISSEPEFQALATRLEDIGNAVANIPQSLPLNSLEQKLQMLSSAVESLSAKDEPSTPQFVELIEQRLDEISRAIVASSASVHDVSPNTENFERIEARMSSLARQIEELTEVQAPSGLIERMNILAERVEDLTEGVGNWPGLPDDLVAQIAALSEKLDASPQASGSESMMSELEDRYDHLVNILERQHDLAEQQNQALRQDLEARLDSVAASSEANMSTTDHDAIIRAIDQRFNQLTQQLDESAAREPDDHIIRNFGDRLDEISKRLDSTDQDTGSIAPDLIENLQGQIAGLTAQLDRPEPSASYNDELEPRVREIEHSVADNRNQIMEAAREAAEWAISSLPAGGADGGPSVQALADDLRSLEQLTRNADERTGRTFEAIHDTLLKIVDRLGSLETRPSVDETHFEPDAAIAPESKVLGEFETPPIAPGDDDSSFRLDEADTISVHNQADTIRIDDQIEQQAASSVEARPVEDIPPSPEMADPVAEPENKSMLGGLTKALRGRGQNEPAPEAEPAVNDVTGEQPFEAEADDANRLLEPGSGAPDLGSIMAKVSSGQAGAEQGPEMDAAKSDFIAAARRAARAAAAEAETNQIRQEAGRAAGPFKRLEALKRQKKPILVGASVLLVALAGLQLGKAFFQSGDDVAVATQPVIEESNEPLAANLADLAADIPVNNDQPVRIIAAGDPTSGDKLEDQPEAVVKIEPERVPDPVVAQPSVQEEETISPAPSATIAAIPVEAGTVALREAAQTGDAKALYEIGSRYADGRGVKSDLTKAAKWYQISADLGFAPAQYRIGNFYEKGLGMDRDPMKAMTWYQLAAEQGNASAMHNLAVLHAMGAAGQPDNDSAARWFLKAADLGVKDSQFNLAILSAKGVGVPQNLEESYKWFALAAKSGDKDAASKRDEIANALRPDQLANARAVTDLWKAKPLVVEANAVDIPAGWNEDGGRTASIDMKKAVRNIQLILNKNGYDAGPADGIMGAKTKTAITAFQSDNGMPATGKVDETLIKALLAKNE